MGETLFPLCGSSLLNNNTISSSTITQWWVWVAWAICMAWMVLCFFSKLMNGRPPKIVRSRLDSALLRHPWIKLLGRIVGRLHGRLLISIITSTICFIVQFYLIRVFSRHEFVSPVWSFGQIIAVTVWLPSIFEYGHDVLSKCYVTCTHRFEEWLNGVDSRKGPMEPKYPSPLGVMKNIIQQTVTMANYRPIGRSNYAALSSSDIEAVPLQNLSPAVHDHGTGQENQQGEIVIEDSVKAA